jgi:hypothetical protein
LEIQEKYPGLIPSGSNQQDNADRKYCISPSDLCLTENKVYLTTLQDALLNQEIEIIKMINEPKSNNNSNFNRLSFVRTTYVKQNSNEN